MTGAVSNPKMSSTDTLPPLGTPPPTLSFGTPSPAPRIPGCRVQGSGFRVQGAGFRVQGAGCRVQGSWFRVLGSGIRVQG